MIYPLHFEGIDAEGRISEANLFKLPDDAISAYDALVKKYGAGETPDDAA